MASQQDNEEDDQRYGAVSTQPGETHYIVRNFLNRPAPTKLSIAPDYFRASSLDQPTVHIDSNFLRRQIAALHASVSTAHSASNLYCCRLLDDFMYSYTELMMAFHGSQLLNDCLKLQRAHAHVLQTVVPQFIREKKKMDFGFILCFFMVFNQFRRHLHVWNVALAFNFHPFLHLVLSRPPPPLPPHIAALAKLAPRSNFDIASSHLQSLCQALNRLVDSIHLVAYICYENNNEYFQSFYSSDDPLAMGMAF